MTDESWKQALAEHTGQWAFMLNVSRRMVLFLQIIRDGEYYSEKVEKWTPGSPYRHFVTTNGCLEQRGLIQRVQEPTNLFNGVQQYRLNWKLTPAGECVCQLLVFAGLMPERKRGRKRAAA